MLTSARRIAFSIAFVGLMAGYAAMAPTSLGGPVTYIKIVGRSMEPSLHAGDFVLARRAAAYGPGDVAAYHNPDLGLVLHRIVARDHGRFVLQGDANSWTDSYRPLPEDVAGRLWVRIPTVGRYLNLLRPPWATIAFFGVGLAAVAYAAFGARARARASRGPKRRAPPRMPAVGQPLTMYSAAGGALSVACLVALLAGLAFAAVAWTRPLTESTQSSDGYEQRGVFRYWAPAPTGVYQTDTIRAGEPVFAKLTEVVEFEFEYYFAAQRSLDAFGPIEGTRQMVAVLSQGNGWERTVPLSPATAFTGASTKMTGRLDIRSMRDLVDEVESLTGARYEVYSLTIAPTVEPRSGDGSRLDRFAPRLALRFSSLLLQVERQDGAPDPLVPSATGSVPRTHVVPAKLSLLGLRLPIAGLRRAAPVGVFFALAGLGLLAALTFRASRDPVGRIDAQYGALITRARLARRPDHLPVLSIARFEELAAIARSQNLPIVCDEGTPGEYFVLAHEATFQHVLPGGPRRGAAVKRSGKAA